MEGPKDLSCILPESLVHQLIGSTLCFVTQSVRQDHDVNRCQLTELSLRRLINKHGGQQLVLTDHVIKRKILVDLARRITCVLPRTMGNKEIAYSVAYPPETGEPATALLTLHWSIREQPPLPRLFKREQMRHPEMHFYSDIEALEQFYMERVAKLSAPDSVVIIPSGREFIDASELSRRSPGFEDWSKIDGSAYPVKTKTAAAAPEEATDNPSA